MWAERCEYWAEEPTESKHRGRPPRHVNRPLVITGHGMSLNVHQRTLLIKSGFTRYPQQQAEHRFFPGDREMPSRIIVVDGTGTSISGEDIYNLIQAARAEGVTATSKLREIPRQRHKPEGIV
jgi:hypothetical protein